MTTHRHQKHPCPACNAQLDSATGPNGVAPVPGDVSICMSCYALLKFTSHDGETALLTQDDLRAMDSELRVHILTCQDVLQHVMPLPPPNGALQ